jgi:hypothetical protein
LALATAALGGGLIGCGGSSDDTSSAAGEAPNPPAEGAARLPGNPERNRSGGGGGVKGGGEADHFEGGEEQVENSGSEAAGSGRDAVLSAERAYLSALIDGDYARACELASQRIGESLQAMVPPGSKPSSCSAILSNLIAGSATRAAEQQVNGRVTKVRIEGEHGFVIFHAPGARLYAYPMVREGNAWKVGALNAAVLAPSAATLGEP